MSEPEGTANGEAVSGRVAELAVRCTKLRHTFGTHVAVDDIDLAIEKGTVFGLLGPNGAGKTTAIRMMTTLLPTAPGSIEVFGVDVARDKLGVRRLIGYVPQQLSADGALTGRENVALFARLFDIPRRDRKAAVDTALELVGLTDVAERTAKTYSGGMVRRLELAQAMVSAPRLLILDEPTIGLDPVARSSVWQRIQEARDATGMTVLVTTHYMEEADQECDRIALMHRGRIRQEGTPDELKSTIGTDATLEDVFRSLTGDGLGSGERMRDVRAARRTARRLG